MKDDKCVLWYYLGAGVTLESIVLDVPERNVTGDIIADALAGDGYYFLNDDELMNLYGVTYNEETKRFNGDEMGYSLDEWGIAECESYVISDYGWYCIDNMLITPYTETN